MIAMSEMIYSGPSAKPHDSGVAVAVVVANNGQVLLLKRKGSTGEGTWAIPGGGVEFAEDPIDAAKRELKEETGLTTETLEFIGYTNDVHDETPLHYVTLRFMTAEFQGEPVVAEPHKASEIGWFPVDELPEPMFPFTQQILERANVINKIKTSS